MDDGRPEAPERDVLEPVLPAPEQRGRDLAGACCLVDLGLTPPAVLARVVGGQAGVLDEAGRQLVHRGDRAAEVCGEAGPRREAVEPQRVTGNLGVHGCAPALGQVCNPTGAGMAKGSLPRSASAASTPRSTISASSAAPAAACCGARTTHRLRWASITTAVSKWDTGLGGPSDVEGVESRHGDGRQGGEGERGSNHPPRIGGRRSRPGRPARRVFARLLPSRRIGGPRARPISAAYGDRRDRSG